MVKMLQNWNSTDQCKLWNALFLDDEDNGRATRFWQNYGPIIPRIGQNFYAVDEEFLRKAANRIRIDYK
jgi:hypothetical protein